MVSPIQPPTTITSTDLQRKIGEIMQRVAKQAEHFIVERDGFPTLAIISVTEYEKLVQDQKPDGRWGKEMNWRQQFRRP